MENAKKPYVYSYENEATRTELREHENWYYQQGYTGAEAFRACKLALRRWHKLAPDDDYILFLLRAIGTIDVAPYIEFALALEEVIDERDAVWKTDGTPIDVLPVPRDLWNVNWEDCTCCPNCLWGPKRTMMKPYAGHSDSKEDKKK